MLCYSTVGFGSGNSRVDGLIYEVEWKCEREREREREV